jgi:hypothetical protein
MLEADRDPGGSASPHVVESGRIMTLRIEAARRRGPHDPRWPARRPAAAQHAIEEPPLPERMQRVPVSPAEPDMAQWETEGGAAL